MTMYKALNETWIWMVTAWWWQQVKGEANIHVDINVIVKMQQRADEWQAVAKLRWAKKPEAPPPKKTP